MAQINHLQPSAFNYFQSFFNNASENNILLMDPEGNVIDVNKAFTQNFGYELQELKGKNFELFFTDDDRKKGKPQHELDTVIKKGQASDNNYLVSKNRTTTWVSGESVLVSGDNNTKIILKVIQNIHRQKEAEVSLTNLNNFKEDILKSIEDIVLVLNEKLQIINANKAFLVLFEKTEGEVENLNFADVIRPFDVFEEIQFNIQKTINSDKGFSNLPVEIETALGEKRVFDVSCALMPQQEDGNNYLIVIHDITVHKQVQREREDIIGFVAHELRNPLANLVLCNELMNEAVKEENVKDIADMLQRSKNNISRLNKMITELYDATKISSGKLNLDVTSFNFMKMIHEAVETIKVLQPAYRIEVSGDGNLQVEGDQYRLIQVVTNYLSNGIKYSDGRKDVTLSVWHNDKTINVCVKDEGLGISKSQLPYIFQRFFRAEKTSNLEGIGLGLYLCQKIIHAHNGSVWAESEEGKGSSFYFSIPIHHISVTNL